jgi:membrane protease YdiL (CAAX protease family)
VPALFGSSEAEGRFAPVTAATEAPNPLARFGGAVWRIGLYAVLYVGFLLAGSVLVPGARSADPFSPVGAAVALGAALLAGWVMLHGVERRPFGALGLPLQRAALRESALGLAAGVAVLGAAVLPVVLTGDVHWVPDGGTPSGYARAVLGALGFLALAAALEEVLFRGYPFQVLVNGVGAWPAAVGASALFAWAHRNNPGVGPLALANISLAGVLLSWAYLRTRSLWFATGVHLGWNWAMAALLDLPVSGLRLETPLYTPVETGADWWTGGDFGPEAGLAASLALLGGTAWVLRSRRVREAPEVRPLRPLVDEPFWARAE